MTDKEKLEKCIEFIRKVEKFDTYDYDFFDDDDDGMDRVVIAKGIDCHEMDRLKDEAWHLLADLTD